MSTSTALNTSSLCKYFTRTSLLIREIPGQRRSSNEGCNYLMGLTVLSIEVSAGFGVTLSDLAFVTSVISIITS